MRKITTRLKDKKRWFFILSLAVVGIWTAFAHGWAAFVGITAVCFAFTGVFSVSKSILRVLNTVFIIICVLSGFIVWFIGAPFSIWGIPDETFANIHIIISYVLLVIYILLFNTAFKEVKL